MVFSTVTEKQTRTLTMKVREAGTALERQCLKAERCGKRGVEIRQKDSGFDKKSLQDSEKQSE